MTDHLWTDERIQRRYDELNAIAPGYPDLNMRDVAREIRDDLQQRIADLEAECAKLNEWQPLSHGVHRPGILIYENGAVRFGRQSIVVQLPDDVRLCRRVSTSAGLKSWCKAVEKRLQADINQQKEDMAEIERLRSLLPSAEVRKALAKMTILVDKTSTGELVIDPDKTRKSNILHEIMLCYAWLNSLESESAE